MAVRILSIDGGGIRGILAAYWLSRLEAQFNGKLRDRFNLFAGTSTGAIIAAGLASGLLDAQDILDLYCKRGSEIFVPLTLLKAFPAPLSFAGLRPTYDGAGLERVVHTKNLIRPLDSGICIVPSILRLSTSVA